MGRLSKRGNPVGSLWWCRGMETRGSARPWGAEEGGEQRRRKEMLKCPCLVCPPPAQLRAGRTRFLSGESHPLGKAHVEGSSCPVVQELSGLAAH